MTSPQILAQLASLQQMMRDLLRSAPETDADRCFHPQLASLGWYLGRSVYRETYWLREVLAGDGDLTDRARHLFTYGAMELEDQCARLPPPDHLLNWAAEAQDENLRRMATPGALPASQLLEHDRLQWFLLQEGARDYERMLMVLHTRELKQPDHGYCVQNSLTPRVPEADLVEVGQGHYRIGSRHEPFACDNELPPQAVELSGFRIARRPVSNAEYLAFMETGGYRRDAFGNGAPTLFTPTPGSNPSRIARHPRSTSAAIGSVCAEQACTPSVVFAVRASATGRHRTKGAVFPAFDWSFHRPDRDRAVRQSSQIVKASALNGGRGNASMSTWAT
jgi:hypothetical protein